MYINIFNFNNKKSKFNKSPLSLMIHGKLSVETGRYDNTLSVPSDQKAQIIEHKSPSKLKDELSPLPKVEPGVKSNTRAKRTTARTISEYKTFGDGAIDLMCCRFDPDDILVAAGTSDGHTLVYSLSSSTGRPLHRLIAAESLGTAITCMRWRPHVGVSKTRHILVTGCADGSITHWHVPSGKMLHRITEADNQVLALDYNRDGTNFATGGKDQIVRVYDENTKSLITELSGGFWQYPGHSNRIFALKFSPEDPNILLSAGWDNAVYFWDIRDKSSFASIAGPAVSGDSIDLKGGLLLTGSWRNKDQLELWDFGSREKVRTIDWEYGNKVETAYVYACQFSKNNEDDVVAGCSNLNEVKVFDRLNDYRDYGKISNGEQPIYSVDFAKSMDLFSFCGGDGHVNVMQIKKA